MRGGTKTTVVVLHAVATITSAALVGLVLGGVALGLGVPPPAPWVVVALVVIALIGDAAATRWSWARPLAVRSQVPIAWSRLFDPRTVAVLYGARLGVGPLTLLPTWLWWAAVLAGAAAGPLVSVAVGVTFGAVRAGVTLGVGEALRHNAVSRMRTIQRLGFPVSIACALVAVASAALAIAA